MHVRRFEPCKLRFPLQASPPLNAFNPVACGVSGQEVRPVGPVADGQSSDRTRRAWRDSERPAGRGCGGFERLSSTRRFEGAGIADPNLRAAAYQSAHAKRSPIHRGRPSVAVIPRQRKRARAAFHERSTASGNRPGELRGAPRVDDQLPCTQRNGRSDRTLKEPICCVTPLTSSVAPLAMVTLLVTGSGPTLPPW